MHNKKAIEKICDVSCSFEELEAFVINIDKKEFDLDSPFEKYYDLQKILFAIKRYENNEIDYRYLANWMNAYNWIIMGGFKIETKDDLVTFKKWIQLEISDWLDSLSFFDDFDDFYNLGDYKKSFAVLDIIYRNCFDWDCVFAHTDELGDNEDDVVVLVSNSKSKQFVKIHGQLDYLNEELKFPRLELDQLEKEIDQLKENGYQELEYGTWHEEEN